MFPSPGWKGVRGRDCGAGRGASFKEKNQVYKYISKFSLKVEGFTY